LDVLAFVELALSAELSSWAGLDVITHANLIAVKARSAVLTVNMLDDSIWIVEDILISQVDERVRVRRRV
jgi:hypothetical protein